MKKERLLLPVTRCLRKIGEDIYDARRRRGITKAMMAQRAGINVITLSKIERGDAGTSMGAYVSVLYVLGMTDRLSDIADASHDLTGIMLSNEKLPKRVRMKRKG